MKRFLLSTFLLFALFSISAIAQVVKVSGNVKDAAGESVIGATVMEVNNLRNATSTGLDGEWQLELPSDATVKISCIGYKSQEVKINGKSVIEVILEDDTALLESVVVTGYGSKRLRAKVTNSIAQVKEERFSVGMHSNPAQALSGAVSGLRVIQSSGNPGAAPTIVLRGGTNFDGSGSPLVIVDGQLRSSMSDINPEDIESMEVLKDAGATALYGARASNGVILITTKTGRAGHSELNLKAKVGLNFVNLPHKFVGARDYLTYIRKAYLVPWANATTLSGAQPYGTGNVYGEDGKSMIWNVMNYDPKYDHLLQKGWETMDDPVYGGKIMFKETDPMDYNFQNPALTQDYNVNMSGGNDRGNYYAGLGYNNSQGIPYSSFYKRYSFIFNGSYKINSWLTSTSNFNFNRANWNSMPGSNASEQNYFGRSMSVPKTVRFSDEDGNDMLGNNSGDGNQHFQHEKWWRDYQSDKFTMIQSFHAQLFPTLSLKGTANWYYSENVQESFNKDIQTNQAGTGWNRGRSSSAYFAREFDQTYNLVLNYDESFGYHSVSALLGGEYYDHFVKTFTASGSGAPTDDFADLALTLNGDGKRNIDSSHYKQRIASFFGRVDYDYKDKYLFSATFREDGYSSLLDNRWGFFPGVSAGWVFGKEDFIANAIPALSFGKLRLSYGINGNASKIEAYTLQGSYRTQVYNGNTGFLISELPNPSLRWEKTKTLEGGLDVSFWNNRLNAALTVYNRLTEDKYASFALPATTGFTSIETNNGKIRNRGIELDLSANIIKKGDFRWDLSANISYNRNVIVKLPENGIALNRQGGTEVYTGEGNNTIFVGGYQEGQEPGAIIGYVSMGIFNTDAEINSAYPGGIVKTGNGQGKWLYTPDKWATLSEADKAKGLLLAPGDVHWKDFNGDGIIDQFDQKKLGNTTPHWIGGLTTNFSWKGLRFYAAFDYAFGFKNYDYTTPWYLGCMQGTYNAPTEVFDTWSPDNKNAKFPRYVFADQNGTGNYYRNSSMFAYNGAYLSFREISLSYAFPKALANKIACQGIELSLTAQNLGYLTAAPVAVPETVRDGGIASGTGYPLPRTIIFGLNVTF